jgi:hypothetical protein
MIKEQANMSANPATIIELTDEELASMHGGCHHADDDCDWHSDCDDSWRSCDSGDGGCWDGGDRFSFSGFGRFRGDRW